MGHCPFCTEKIDENVLLYGGSCPKCFAEIPGEEAATDPGAEVRAKQAKSDSRRAAIRTIIPILLMVPLLGGLAMVALGFVIWNRDPVLEPINLDDMFDAEGLDYAIVAAPAEDEKDPDVDAKTPKPAVKPKPAGTAAGTNDTERVAQNTQAKPAPQPQVGGIAKTPSAPKPQPKPGGLDLSIGFNVEASRQGEMLTDPGQISKMVLRRVREQQSTLTQCYNEALGRNPNLAGRWKANFVIQKSGVPSQITFTGRTMSDAEMEQCLVNTVKRWTFGKIVSTQPVQKTWKFGI